MSGGGSGWRGGREGHSLPRNGNYNNRWRKNLTPPRGRPTLRGAEEWSTWAELTVRIHGLPQSAFTINLYDMLSTEGKIARIDLTENPDGTRTGDAFVTFCPPPTRAFWDLDDWKIQSEEHGSGSWPLKIILQDRKRTFQHRSPVHPSKTYPERMVLYPETMEIGFMYRQDKMMAMHNVKSSSIDNVTILLNLLRRELVFEFSVVIPDARLRFSSSQTDRVKFQIPLHQLDTVWEMDSTEGEKTLVITLDKPPAFYRKLHDVEQSFNDGKHWNDRFSWARMTDIKQRGHEQDDGPLRLKKSDHVIDIGRWTTYKLTFSKNKLNRKIYDLLRTALGDYNVKFINPGHFETLPRTNVTVWNWIDLPESRRSARESFLEVMSSDVRHLSWPVRYQLESCISQGCLNERNITKDFIQRLESIPEKEALLRLEAAADQKKRIFEPMDIFTSPTPRSPKKKIPGHCVLQRSATVTPSTIYFSPPTVEMSNRILRQYKEHADRFLRVRFTDEKFEGRIHATDDDTLDAVYTRVYHCLTRGIKIGDRHFEFFAMGNAQFREHGAYFFASTPTLKVADMRAKLGKIGRYRNGEFVPERVVAKFASRLGQAFSTTHPIRAIKLLVVEIADVERNGYTFTDGVGKLSSFVAKLIANELNLRNPWMDPPSLFQFRMGGVKGVVAVSPEAKGREIHIRSSQYKFAVVHEGLEIIRWSSYSVPRLNRQLIAVLQSLRIRDEIFLKKLDIELFRLDSAMENEAVALPMLQEQVDFNQMTLTVANIMLDGFMSAKDPFAVSILRLWRAWSTKLLKEKAALAIPEGAFLLGCTDETATLRGYFGNIMPKMSASVKREDCVRALPEIFVQVPDFSRNGQYRVIEEVCIVARNPSLHPGDIRVVRAVNVPKLHHLKDVVVFAQTGDRDVPSMCSGGDLDGDDFLVIWDKELIPPLEEWDVPAMDFTSPKPREVDEVTVNDIVSFFVTYMKTDTLRTIANSHIANADQLPGGVRHWRCLKLAEEHSTAVDYPKSGIPPNPIYKIRPSRWPHFMPNRNRPKEQIYHSNTILGQLYDRVPQADFRPMLDFPFDTRVLEAFPLGNQMMEDATEVKAAYDAAMHRIMAQHDIKTEFEVWTTFVMDHARLSNDYKFHEEIGRISTNLKEQFTEMCYEKVGGKNDCTYEIIAPFVAAMYTVTAIEVAAALKNQKENMMNAEEGGTTDLEPEELPLISFPWLFHHELGKIARGARANPPGTVLTQQAVPKRHTRKAATLIDLDGDDDDIIETEKGVTHRGDLLELALKSYEGETLADRQHAAMVEQNIKEANAGAKLENKPFTSGPFKLDPWHSGVQSAVAGELEEGEIRDEAWSTDSMDGVETWPKPPHEQSHGQSSFHDGLETRAEPLFYDARQHQNTNAAEMKELDEDLLDFRQYPGADSKPQPKHETEPYSSNNNTGDIDMIMDGDLGNDETTEEVMIDVDDTTSPFDKLEQILRL